MCFSCCITITVVLPFTSKEIFTVSMMQSSLKQYFHLTFIEVTKQEQNKGFK